MASGLIYINFWVSQQVDYIFTEHKLIYRHSTKQKKLEIVIKFWCSSTVIVIRVRQSGTKDKWVDTSFFWVSVLVGFR